MDFDKKKIGKLFNLGGEHVVYNYNGEQVIKFPNILAKILFNNRKLAEKKQADLKICQEYFSEYLLTTEFLAEPAKRRPYGLIQPRVVVRPLSIKDLKNNELRDNFFRILKINNKLKEKHRLSFDFLGAWRLVFNWLLPTEHLSNLMVNENNEIIILDIVFLEYQKSWSKLLLWISRWAEKKQQRVIKKFINYARRVSF